MNVSREIFNQQRSRRFGTANPERMRLEHWEWMIRHRCGPETVRKQWDLRWSDDVPDWCFSRFGMSRTDMPDGRTICIGGEHEDWYDPDFCIYNDVIVLRPPPGKAEVDADSGDVEIYGYPESVFPPTDFHSATLVQDRIFVIGRLGYRGTRVDGVTPILTVNASTYEVEQVSSSGRAPGWIYRHHASFEEGKHSIIVRGGVINIEGAKNETPHLSVYRLHLDGLRWELVSAQESHRRFLFERGKQLGEGFYMASAETFRPANVPHLWLPSEIASASGYKLDVAGARVTFLDLFGAVETLIEGDLPSDVVEQLLTDVVSNLRRDTKAAWTVTEVDDFERSE